MDEELVKQVGIPAVALVAGGICTRFARSPFAQTAGKLVLYFGAQTGMNIYMKVVLSRSVVKDSDIARERLLGMPAPGMVTALQQVTSFFIFAIILSLSRVTSSHRYEPAKLKGAREWFAMLVFACSFALNISLNNYSLSLVPLSINLIIRSCSTLAACLSQMAIARAVGGQGSGVAPSELGCMFAGTLFAALAVVAKSQPSHGPDASSDENRDLALGVAVCVVSLFCGALNLALAGLLGTSMRLNPFDTVLYMSIPTILVLLGPIFLLPHPVSWPGHGNVTDWDVFRVVMKHNSATVGLAVLSGAFALCLNVLVYSVVQTLSATHTAFAGNFNKAATIMIAVAVGLERLPSGPWGVVMFLCVFGNIASFTAYSALTSRVASRQGPSIAVEAGEGTLYDTELTANLSSQAMPA